MRRIAVQLATIGTVTGLALASGCGGKAVIDGNTSGDGGNQSTVSVGSSVSSTASSTGSGGTSCTGTAECGPSDYCDFPDGTCGGQGVCRPRPVECPDACIGGYCGCDNTPYCSECHAQLEGIDGPGPCVGPIEARAGYLLTGAVRIGVAVWDPGFAVCTTYVLEPFGQAATPVVATNPWVVARIGSYDDVDREECFEWLLSFPAVGDPVTATGSIELFGLGNDLVCSINLDTTIEFAKGGISTQQLMGIPTGEGCD